MQIKSGRHANQTTEYVLLRYGNDANYIMRKHPYGFAGKAYRSLVKRFDAKPFATSCRRCENTATRASAYRGAPSLLFWCDACDPYGEGANPGMLVVIRSYIQAISHIDESCDGYREWKNDIIRSLAEAKGCPRRLTQKAAVEFFVS